MFGRNNSTGWVNSDEIPKGPVFEAVKAEIIKEIIDNLDFSVREQSDYQNKTVTLRFKLSYKGQTIGSDFVYDLRQG